MVSKRPANPGTASGAGAHSAVIAQLWVESGVDSEKVCEGTVPCSGISHSALAGCLIRPRHAADPRTGWSCRNSRTAAKAAFIQERYSLCVKKGRGKYCARSGGCSGGRAAPRLTDRDPGHQPRGKGQRPRHMDGPHQAERPRNQAGHERADRIPHVAPEAVDAHSSCPPGGVSSVSDGRSSAA